jgi:DNA repair exonuclease SbcCD nuclease subunit
MQPSISKFIQTGDIHIGASRSLEGYLERHKQVLTQVMDLAYNKGMPLLITGDLTHSKTTTHDESYLLHWWLSEIEKRKIPTVVIAGNHDHLYGEVTQIDELKCMPFQHIKIVTWHPDIHIINDLGIICIPWRNYSSEDIKKIVMEKLPLLSSCKYKVVMLHECISGVTLDSGFILTKGTALPNIREITYWAVGDIHKFQKTNLVNGYYSGSPTQFNFDDSLPKGIIEVDLEYPSKKPTLIPLTFKPLKTISTVQEIDDDAYYKLIGGYEEVIKANKENLVVATEYDKRGENSIEYIKVGILDGLSEFLAGKGIDETYQKKGIDWVSKLLRLENA